MTARDFNFARLLWSWFVAAPPRDTPAEFAVKELRFDYSSEMRGPCNFDGRHYLIRPINDAADSSVRKQTKVFGRGNGKTLCDEVQICFKLKHNSGARGLGVYPATKGEGGSENFTETRLKKTILASPGLKELLPKKGQERFYVNRKMVRLNGSHYGFIGSNSASQGVSNRLTDIYFDEMEKFSPTLKSEAGIDKLAEGSVEGVSEYQIHYSSTPTIEGGLIWTSIWKSNLHIYFLPCPLCSSLVMGKPITTESERAKLAESENFKGWFALLFSDRYSAGWPVKFANGKKIPFATVKFRHAHDGGNDAKKPDGGWDFARVASNAHLVCPHCAGEIRDADVQGKIDDRKKRWMDANGFWHCVSAGEPGHVGYLINSLYAPVMNSESTLGGRAVKFITAVEEGGEAVRTFINSILAGVYSSQERGRIETDVSARPFAQPDWIPILTADYHKNHPYLWFVVRKWCAFKLLPKFTETNGIPDFVSELDAPENKSAREVCEQLTGRNGDASAAWRVVGEIARFNSNDPATGRSPLIDFLIAQKIVGARLVKMFDESGDALEFRRRVLLEMWRHVGGDEKDFRAPRGGDSELVAAGYCDCSGEYAWDELKGIILEFKVGQGLSIPLRAVAVDCGFAENKNRVVLQKCHESATEFDFYDPTVKTKNPSFTNMGGGFKQIHGWNGWQAIRGKPTFQPQGDGLGRDLGKHVEDPYFGTPKGGTSVVDILEIPTALFWLRKDDLRQKRTKQFYSISPQVSFFPKRFLPDGSRLEESIYKIEDYQKQSTMMIHDEEKGIVRPRFGVGGAQSKRHPDHPDDCETYQVALATHLEFFEDSTTK